MPNTYKINSVCLKYIVPFRFHGDFDETVNKVDKLTKFTEYRNGIKEERAWKRKLTVIGGPESDLYSYVRDEFHFDDDIEVLSEYKSGCEWELLQNKSKEFLYFPNGIKNADKNKDNWSIPPFWKIKIYNVRLMLFRNSLGFALYELSVPTNIDSQQLMHFQNAIRELNRGTASLLWEEQRKKPEDMDPDYGILIKDFDGNRTYIAPFSLGYWINQNISFLDVSYLAERKSAYATMLKNSMSKLNGLENRVITCNEYVAEETSIPDKAILFTYASFSGETDEKSRDERSLVYHLTNGYKDTYHMSDEVSREIKMPFDNAFWYATQEGASYIVWPKADNREVFDKYIPSKIRVDYFSLYLKTLYQSFSLLMYAERIQSEISAKSEGYLSKTVDEKITKLFEEINVFLTKSMATSVSHIHHQSEFYIYLKQQLRIHEDVKSVTAGLNALDSLQREQRNREESRRVQEAFKAEQERDREAKSEREKREEREKKSDNKMQAIMGLFALLGISSALVDCFDFIGKFSKNGGDFWILSSFSRGVEITFLVVIGVVSVITARYAIKALIDAFRDK